MSHDIRLGSAHASETALSVASDWTPWVIAIAPALVVVANLTERGGVVGFMMAFALIVPAATLLLDQRRTFKAQIKDLAAATARAEQAANELRQELEHAEAILEGRTGPSTRGRIPKRLRHHVAKRCNHSCQFCARPGTPDADPDGQPWHIEHVIPVSRGGPTRADNLTLACASCNLRKGTTPAYAFIQQLIREGQRK